METDVDARASTNVKFSRGYAVFAGALILVLVWLRYQFGYPLFHTATELMSAVIAFSIFTVTWNTRHVASNRYLEVMGVAFLFAGAMGLLHLIAFGNAGALPVRDASLATQLWLAGRLTLASAVLIAPFAVGQRSPRWPLALVWIIGATASALAVARSFFPTTMATATGLARFAVVADLAALGCLLAGWYLLTRRRDAFDEDVYRLLTGFLVASVLAEAAFLPARGTMATAAFTGHLLRFLACLLIYRAAAVMTLSRPYDTLFREARRTAEALRVSEDLLQATVSQASVGIVRLDLTGSILMANPRALEITGRSTEELLGRSIASFTRVENPESLMTRVASLQAGHITSFRTEAEVARPDGAQTIASVALSSVCDESGDPQYFIGVIEDVTAQRLAERALERSRDLNAALGEMDIAVNSTSDEGEIIARATESAWRALRCDAAVALTREETAWLARCSFGLDEDVAGLTLGLDALRQASEAVEAGSPLVVDDVREAERLNPGLVERFSLMSTMAIPLTFREEVLGVLYVLYRNGVHRFSEPEIDFARKLASSLSLAMENARLYSSERLVADTLQSALLVAPPSLPGLSVGTAYESATELSRVGGDFYDVLPLGDTRIAFMTGDVAGKGLEAATFTAAARTTIRAFTLQTGSPAEALEAANAALSLQLEAERFVTCLLGVIDVADGTIRLASAGHPEPAICAGRNGCAFREIDRNPPLGVVADATFSEHRSVLTPGDRIVAFTDGLLDARYGAALFGEDGVLAVLSAAGPEDSASAARLLLDAARGFSGGHLKDDIAVVVLDYEGPPATELDG